MGLDEDIYPELLSKEEKHKLLNIFANYVDNMKRIVFNETTKLERNINKNPKYKDKFSWRIHMLADVQIHHLVELFRAFRNDPLADEIDKSKELK